MNFYYVNSNHNRTLWDIIYNDIPEMDDSYGAYNIAKDIECVIQDNNCASRFGLKYGIRTSADNGWYKVSIYDNDKSYEINKELVPVERVDNNYSRIVERYTNLDIKDYLKKYSQVKDKLPDEFYRFVKSYIYNKYDIDSENAIGESVTYCGATIEMVEYYSRNEEYIFKITFPTEESTYLHTIQNGKYDYEPNDDMLIIDILHDNKKLSKILNQELRVQNIGVLLSNLKFMVRYMNQHDIAKCSDNYTSSIKLDDLVITMFVYIEKDLCNDRYTANLKFNLKYKDHMDINQWYRETKIILTKYTLYQLDKEYIVGVEAYSDIINKLEMDGQIPEDTSTIRIKFDKVYVLE